MCLLTILCGKLKLMRRFRILFVTFALAFMAFSCKPALEPDLDAAWYVVLESLDEARTRECVKNTPGILPTRIERRGKTVELVYENAGDMDIDVSFKYIGTKNGFEVEPAVVNRRDGYVVVELAGPFVSDPGIDTRGMDLLVPHGIGARYRLFKAEPDKYWAENAEEGCLEGHFEYFGQNCSMQWAEFTGDGKNLYFASHDPKFRWKDFLFRYYRETEAVRFAFRHHFTCFPGETYTCPQTRLKWIEGDWKAGAREYRTWFRKVHDLPKKPEWVSRSGGWLLTILKQQNDIVMWDYEETGTTLLDVAQARGLDIIGLFGWTIGGHDRFYPDYDPDPRMGGEEGLRKAVERIHERGMKAVFYFNGQLIDQNGTRFWPDTGRFITSVGPDGNYLYERWWKYADIEPRIHGLACLGSDVWRRRLLNLTKKVYDYGADGAIYDQLATRPPMLCYGEGHGHTIPAVVFEQDRTAILEYLSKEMHSIDPEFLIMTEGISDCEVNSGAAMFHEHSENLRKSMDEEEIHRAFVLDDRPFFTVFPDMFHYTVPEADFTVRTPTPASTHQSINFGTVFGYKQEIETRYMPDKLYLTQNRIPAWEEYDIVKGSKPKYSTLRDQDPVEVAAYSKAVLSFRKEHADIFYDGEFSSDEGFSLESESPYVIARSYINGGRMGVVAWNTSGDESASFDIIPEKGWKLVGTAAPEGTPAEGPLPAQTLRLLILER